MSDDRASGRPAQIITDHTQLLRRGTTPLDWSFQAYKLTLGVGMLGMAALLADSFNPRPPFWIIAIVTLTPLLIFLFITLNGFSPRFIRWAHVLASLWYLMAATFSVVLMLLCQTPSAEPPKMYPLMVVFLAIGAIPCTIVLAKAAMGRYCVENRP